MKKNRLTQTFLDGCPRENVPEKLCDFIDNQFPSARNTVSIDFTGIIWGSGQPPAVFFPKGTEIPKHLEHRSELIRLLIDCLRRYRSSDSKSHSADINSNLLSCPELELIERYQRDGLYSNREKQISKVIKGPIDWKRTINGGNPALNSDGTLFYLDTIRRGYRSSTTQIRKIHAAIVFDAMAELSWLIHTTPCNEVMSSRQMPFSNETSIQLIRAELSKQFSEEKIRLLKLLLAILERDLRGSKSGGSLLGTTKFEHVWEHMISCYLADQKQDFKNLAIPAYVLNSGVVEPSAANSPRPDTILHHGNKIAVVDAKYYNFAISKPQWGDLVKQFFYAKTFEMRFGKENVSNWFVMPGFDNQGALKAIVIDTDGTDLKETFTPIRIRFKDPIDVMKHYASYKINHEDRATFLAE